MKESTLSLSHTLSLSITVCLCLSGYYVYFLHFSYFRVKFQQKILKSLNGERPIFVMSFLGSSVTAGHDTPFNMTFSELTGSYMEKPLDSLGIKVISRNGAMGNNPCIPYNLCVKTYTGEDTDIIHWEQTFNCGGADHNFRSVYEPFVRMALRLESHPILVFSDSVTPNWNEDQCQGPLKSIEQTEEDKKLLDLLETSPRSIPHELNIDAIPKYWDAFAEIAGKYRVAGIQFWNHHYYEIYKCHPPYVANWGCCSASWHPSILGHELRAAHYSYFWLLIFRDAIIHLLEEIQKHSLSELYETMNQHIKAEAKYTPSLSLYPTPYSENLQCYTSLHPIADQKFSLETLRIPDNVERKHSFDMVILENLFDKTIVPKAQENGYQDYKYILVGNQLTGTLSFKIRVQTSSHAFLCQPPGSSRYFGLLPDGFMNLWECGTEIYRTTVTRIDSDSFVFEKKLAVRLTYSQPHPDNYQLWLCVMFDEYLPIGDHILTIVPTTKRKIAIAYLLIP